MPLIRSGSTLRFFWVAYKDDKINKIKILDILSAQVCKVCSHGEVWKAQNAVHYLCTQKQLDTSHPHIAILVTQQRWRNDILLLAKVSAS